MATDIEGQTQTRTQAQRPRANKPIAISIQPTPYTAVPLLWYRTLPPHALLVAKQPDSLERKLSSCSVKTVVSPAKKSATTNRNAQIDGDWCWSLWMRTQHWHGLMLARWLCLNPVTLRRKTNNPHKSYCGRWETIVDLCIESTGQFVYQWGLRGRV